MKQTQWQQAYEQAPASFMHRMDTTLKQLKEEEPMKKQLFRTACLALSALMILTCTAFALSATGVLDTFQPRFSPLPTAQNLIQTNFEQTGGDNEYFTLTVREALSDGYRMRTVYEFRAKSEDIFLYALDFCEDDVVSIDGQQFTYQQLAEGKKCVEVGLPTLPAAQQSSSDNPVECVSDYGDFLYESPDVLIVWEEKSAVSAQDVQQYTYRYVAQGMEAQTDTVSFRIVNAANVQTYTILPCEGERFACLGGQIILSPLYTYTIAEVQTKEALDTIDFWLCDGDENRYDASSGGITLPDEQGVCTYAASSTALETLPEKLQLMMAHYGPFEKIECLPLTLEAAAE